ncbi:hypothetical protein BDU57DRAFT_509983 [Ampelomyces quisqualis]|uniref:Uncharacterized protein n=1 Tax=Ampelomyces quisqualis TaxID=50730 RepID=A0A6A5R5R5_AMPQU|nr:hypothetical protein BDU57DRAFT_509983 [Ampelomyces quisqualis]
MFTFQNITSKRGREVDSDSEDGDGYGHERQQLKKPRWFSDPLTHHHAQNPSPQSPMLRPSLTPPRLVSDVEAMTPAQSDWEEMDCPIPSYGHAQSSQPNDFDMDMEDDHFAVRSQPSQSPQGFFMRPAMLNTSLFGADAVNTNGRIPTPIHPTFKRSGMNGLGFPTSGAAGGLHTSNHNVGVPSMQAPTSRRTAHQTFNDDCSRRLPSPISEDEDIPDTPTALTQSQLSRLSFSQANPADRMDMETSPSSLALPPTTPRGRKRSGALTGMGRFSMGYREDCEKCRQRVPGHYSHFL